MPRATPAPSVELEALLVEPDSKTFYSPGQRGYTDYPLMGAA
jgi:hypothetical protein